MVLPPRLAKLGRTVESRIAPPIYRRTRIVTLSESSKRELVEELGFKAKRVDVVAPGIDPKFSPGGSPDDQPLLVAVGRLVPVKRFHLLIDAVVELRERHPGLRAVIVGEGYERGPLTEQIDRLDASSYVELAGRVTDAQLIDLYRRAWVLASTSAREGWGMTITEAAACGTPAVVTDIAGHRDAVARGSRASSQAPRRSWSRSSTRCSATRSCGTGCGPGRGRTPSGSPGPRPPVEPSKYSRREARRLHPLRTQ